MRHSASHKNALPESTQLIDALVSTPAIFGSDVTTVELVETHISWVLLAGSYAWKIKKPVNFGFLDFSTREKRQRLCAEELRLNRRYAPEIYLEVVAITGALDAPVLGGEGTAIEYAVKMRRFPQDRVLSRQLREGFLQASHIDRLAHEIAEFHARAGEAPADSRFGTPAAVLQPVVANFEVLGTGLADEEKDLRLLRTRLKDWVLAEFLAQTEEFERRRRSGFVRECHGDLHLGNLFLRDDGSIALFDGIEFSEDLRWIDVASEIAFVTMDLEDRSRPDFARRLLNSYLEWTGDYALLPVLRFYQVYRATVRAKVARLRMDQPALKSSDCIQMMQELRGYLTLAERYTRHGRPVLLLTCGLSGSGKSTVSQEVVEHLGAVRVRSDVERKRLYGLGPRESSSSNLAQAMYGPDATQRTYDRLRELAAGILDAGYPAIIDATFLRRDERESCRRLAETRRIPCLILRCEAPVETLRERIRKRATDGGDASEATLAVLDYQLRSVEPLTDEEAAHAISIDTSADHDTGSWIQEIQLRMAETSWGGAYRK